MRPKHIATWKLVVWMMLLLTMLGLTTTALVVVKPEVKIDCDKAMAQWNFFEGQASIAAFKGDEISKIQLQNRYKALVTGPNRVCFPPDLITFITSN